MSTARRASGSCTSQRRDAGGLGASARSAAVGAVVLAIIEGVNIAITRMMANQVQPVPPELAPLPNAAGTTVPHQPDGAAGPSHLAA